MDFTTADAVYPEWIALIGEYNALRLTPYVYSNRSAGFIRIISERFTPGVKIPKEVREAHWKLLKFENKHRELMPLLIFLYEKRHRPFTDEEFRAIYYLLLCLSRRANFDEWCSLKQQSYSEQRPMRESLSAALGDGKISKAAYDSLYRQFDESHRREFAWRQEANRGRPLLLFEELFLPRAIDTGQLKNLRMHGLRYTFYDITCTRCINY